MHLPGYRVQSFQWNEYSNYEIAIPGIYVGGNYKKNLVPRHQDTRYMFDSGTTYIWLPYTVYDPLMEEIDNWCKDPEAKKRGEKRCIGLASD